MKARTIRRLPVPSSLSVRERLRGAASGSRLQGFAACMAVVLAAAFLLLHGPSGPLRAPAVLAIAVLAGAPWLLLRERRARSRRAGAATALASLGQALERAGEATLLLDADARIRVANRPATELTGRTRSDLEGSEARDLFGSAAGSEMSETLRAGHCWRTRFSAFSLRGELQIDARLTPIRRRGRTVSVVALLRDATREAQLEAGAWRSQKLEALGRLTAGVAHDFNNLLMVIEGRSEEALRRAEGDPALRESLLQIRSTAWRAKALTSRLLASGGRRAERQRVVGLADVVREAEGLLRQLLPETIAIEIEAGSAARRVRIDPGRVEQILINLAANARDAMPTGGRLSIRTCDGDPAPGDFPSGSVILEVADTGRGMDDATCDQIFEPFYSTKESEGGAGLGLANVSQIVEQFGGRVEVHTRLGKGTRFRIALPATRDPLEVPASPSAPQPAALGAREERILVVEDDDAVRDLLECTLLRAGFRVRTARDARHARDQLADSEEPPDVLITDVVLPGEDGPTLVRRLRRRWPELRVLYASGYDSDERVARAAHEPRTQLLPKPFDATQLVARIDALLGSGSSGAPPRRETGHAPHGELAFRCAVPGDESARRR